MKKYTAKNLFYESKDSLFVNGRNELSREEQFLKKVRSVIFENVSNAKFTVPKLAAAVDLSVSQLNRKLNALTDGAAGQLIRELRLQQAAYMLSGNVASVGTIAERTGYKNQAHFCRSFKRKFGCSPSEYRNKMEEHLSKHAQK